MVEANLRVSESNIINVSRKVLEIARKHIKKMSLFGISEYYLEDFEHKILDCEDFINRDLEIIELKDLTSRKYKALEDCYNWGRQLSLRVEIAFGKKSNQFENFPSRQLLESQRHDEKMISLMEVLISISKKYSVELHDYGQTAEVIENGRRLLRALKIANQEQENKKNSKKESTKLRREKFQELYEIVNKINKVGRTVYKNDKNKKILFKSQWKNNSPQSKKTKVFKGLVEPEKIVEITQNIRTNKKITLTNTGETVLHFFYSNQNIKIDYREIFPNHTVSLIVRELGEGKILKVENIDTEKTGKYKVVV